MRIITAQFSFEKIFRFSAIASSFVILRHAFSQYDNIFCLKKSFSKLLSSSKVFHQQSKLFSAFFRKLRQIINNSFHFRFCCFFFVLFSFLTFLINFFLLVKLHFLMFLILTFCKLQKAFVDINFDYSSYSFDNEKQSQKLYHNDFDIQKNCFSRLIYSRISTNRSHLQSINFDKRESTCSRRSNNCQFSIFTNTCWWRISFSLFFEMISKRKNLSQRFKSISTWYCWFSTNNNFSKLFCAFWDRFNIWKFYVVNNFATSHVVIYFFRRVNIFTIKCFNQLKISTN